MSRSYPIWNKVSNCSYKSDKSYGNKETGEVEILVGSSSNNSHTLVKHFTTKRTTEYEGQKAIVFRFGIEVGDENIILSEKYFAFKRNGTAGDLLGSRTVSKSTVGL